MSERLKKTSALELMTTTAQFEEHRGAMMTTTTILYKQEEIEVANKVKTSPMASSDQCGQLEHPLRRRSKNSKGNNQIKGHSRERISQRVMSSIIMRILVWSSSKTFTLGLVVSLLKIICLASLITLNIKCDDELLQQQQQQQQIQSPGGYSNQNEPEPQQPGQQQQHHHNHNHNQGELLDLMKQQNLREARSHLNLDDFLSAQGSSSSLSYNLINPTNEYPMTSMYHYQQQQADNSNQQPATGSDTGGGYQQNVAQQEQQLQPQSQQHEQQAMQEQRNADLNESDQLETAQTKAQSNAVATGGSGATTTKSNDSSEKAADAGQSSGSPASPTPSTSSSASSTGSLSDHLSAVNNLLHQAGQIGLSAAQQNVALSEAIINSVTNSLVGNTRNRQNAQQQAAAAAQSTTGNMRPNVVGQSIDGGIDYNPNSNTIDGFINFPGLNGSKPSLSGAMRPLLLAAIKTVPVKFGSVTWKLLKLLAWKKIYKAHHPKQGEIIIEQEIKHGGHGGGSGGIEMDKGGKLGKISDHFENKFKTSKMGNSYMGGGGGGLGDDWPSMMRTPGHGGDMFSSGGGSGGGWPHGDSHASAASMIYQRHLLPPGVTNPLMGGGNGGVSHQHQAAAAAAAAAATAAAIQSHWQQQQQQMMADETSESHLSTRTNQTTGTSPQGSSGASGQGGALRRKKATFGGSNWFAANPAHTYAAAAAAANAAAAMASQHQQQQQHRLANIMRAYELGGQHSDQLAGLGGSSGGSSGGMQHALATGLMYQSLFDNAAAMAVQSTVRLPTSLENNHHHGHNHNPLANAEFLDQSDTLSGSSFDSFSSGGTNSVNDMSDHAPLTLMQRADLEGNLVGGLNNHQTKQLIYGAGGRRHSPFTDSMLTMNENPVGNGMSPMQNQFGPHRSGLPLDGLPDFDDTPVGKLIGTALNESSSHPIQQFNKNHRQYVKWN